jgi:hypothetical protein
VILRLGGPADSEQDVSVGRDRLARTMWLPATVLALTSLLACKGSPATQLMVRVVDGTTTGLNIPGDMDGFEIRVASLVETGELVRFRRTYRLAAASGPVDEGSVALPQTLAIVPDNAAGTGTVDVTVFGLRAGRTVQEIRRVASFGVGLVELPPFALSPLCFGVMCPLGETCEADGVCRPVATCTIDCDGGVVAGDAGPCGAGRVACGDSCIPEDDLNCGACGMACPAGERCISGVCACGVGLARCGGACIDTSADDANCGTCGTSCGGAETCSGGMCVCAGGLSRCSGSCVDTRTDASHCGGCGASCDPAHATGSCAASSCRVASCDGGWGNCNASAADGCETRLDSDANCGDCGNRCGGGETCSGDRCECVPDCGGLECGDDGCGGSCGNCTGMNEVCDSTGVCRCRGGYSDEGAGCQPSCGTYLGERGYNNVGGGCCGTPCVGRGSGFGVTFDCDYCCESFTGTPACS